MNKKCSIYEELFVSSSQEELDKHIQECEDCRAEYEAQQKLSSMLDEVKM